MIYTPQVSPPAGWSSNGIIDEVDSDAPVIPGSAAWRCRVQITPDKLSQILRVKAVKP